MPRKFTFDLPHLKLSSQKAETRHSREPTLIRPSTPPPKSVRPPLSPRTTQELRSACTFIVHNYRPSHKQFDQIRTDHAPARPFAHGKLDTAALVSKNEPWVHASDFWDVPMIEPVSDRKYAYKPGVAAEDLFKESPDPRETSRQSHIGQLPAELDVSTVSQSAHGVVKATLHPGPAQGADPLQTSESTPRTDGTDDPWSEKLSTTMTSAAVTPARNSKLASEPVSQSAAVLPSMPKLDGMDVEWVRAELERRMKISDEQAQFAYKIHTDDPTTSVPRAMAPVSRINANISRKPVASHNDHGTPAASMYRTDSALDADLRQPYYGYHDRARPRERSRMGSRARSISREVKEYFRPGSSQASFEAPVYTSRPASRARSRAHSVTQHIQEYIRPGSTMGSRKPSMDLSQSRERPGSTEPRARSRARSVTQHIQEYIRPGSTTASRKPSVDLSRGRDRQASIDTRHSFYADHQNRPPTASSNFRRMWNPIQRIQHARNDSDASFSGSYDGSIAESRLVNLNRELPPLPGLDQWKDGTDGAPAPSEDVCISWNPSTTKPAERSILLPQSSPHTSPGRARAGHRPAPSEDTTPTIANRMNEMNRQRAVGRSKGSSLEYGLDSPSTTSLTNQSPTSSVQTGSTANPPPSFPHVQAHITEQTKRKWWKGQSARTNRDR